MKKEHEEYLDAEGSAARHPERPAAIRGVLDLAEEVGRRGLRADKRKASPRVRKILAGIEARLYEKELSVSDLEARFSINSRVRRQFADELGMGIKEYLLHRRMTAAAWLLVETTLPIWEIGEFAGYTLARTFTRAFAAWSGGESPMDYRHSRTRHRQCDLLDRRPTSERTWRQILAGGARREGEEVIRSIESPTLSLNNSQLHPEPVLLRKGNTETIGARVLYRWLRRKSHREQLDLIRAHVACASPAFFRLLGKKVLEESRVDRRRGIEVAELALAWANGGSLTNNLETTRASLQALAWVWLGNAYRLAEDFEAAERCFTKVANRRPAAGSTKGVQQIEAEILLFEGSFRYFQRHLNEAEHLLDRAIALSRALGLTELLVRSLLQRGNVLTSQGRFKGALGDLRMAEPLLDELEDAELALQTYQALANTLAVEGNWRKSIDALAKARSLCKKYGHPLVFHQLELVEGIALHGAGELEQAARAFERARLGMISLGSRGYTALVALEFSVLRFEQNQYSEAAALASEALPLFSSLKIDREARLAFKVLRQSIISDRLTEKILVEARDYLRRAVAFG